MNSKFISSLIFISFTFISKGYAQSNLLNARVPQEIGKINEKQIESNDETPLEYGFVDDRDILWSKTVWEVIDLKERINFPYYYPTDSILGNNRRSLYHVLMDNIKKGNIKEIYEDGYFLKKITYQNILDNTSDRELSAQGVKNFNANKVITAEDYDTAIIEGQDVEQYLIKGTWYVNKRLGELKYRLLGIAPVTVSVKSRLPTYPVSTEKLLFPLFWVWFPDARESLNSSYVFNVKNSSQPITFDHMLNSRRFNSLIYKEENVYQDRKIEDYIYDDALKQLLESERIKSVIRDFEQDLWNN